MPDHLGTAAHAAARRISATALSPRPCLHRRGAGHAHRDRRLRQRRLRARRPADRCRRHTLSGPQPACAGRCAGIRRLHRLARPCRRNRPDAADPPRPVPEIRLQPRAARAHARLSGGRFRQLDARRRALFQFCLVPPDTRRTRTARAVHGHPRPPARHGDSAAADPSRSTRSHARSRARTVVTAVCGSRRPNPATVFPGDI